MNFDTKIVHRINKDSKISWIDDTNVSTTENLLQKYQNEGYEIKGQSSISSTQIVYTLVKLQNNILFD